MHTKSCDGSRGQGPGGTAPSRAAAAEGGGTGTPDALAPFLLPAHKLVEATARCHPHAPALRAFAPSPEASSSPVAPVYTLSYFQLHQAARDVGRMMAGSGVREGSRVALLIPRGVEAVLALLGASAAGASYVPLNCAAPVSRLVSLCRAAGVAVVATTTLHIDLGFELVGTLGAGLLLVDRCHHPLEPGDSSKESSVTPNPHPLAKPLAAGEVKEVVPMPMGCSLDDGMVVLFTSGTTAEPKAMELTHRAALHHVAYYAAEFASKQSQPVVSACMSALVFDMHISEIFPAWATGGCVALLDAPDNDLHARIRCLEDATLSMWVPSVLRSCLQAFDAMGRGVPRMKQVFVAGEQLVVSLVQAVFDAWPTVEEVLNAYGPAETHVVTVYPVRRSEWSQSSLRDSPAVPIGKALPGVGLALRNTTTSNSGGQEGELLVSGPCLANGYIGNLSKTSEKFLVDDHGVRWYRTGDHVELNVDGDWVFMGRIDAMLKNRGRRIEPEWVEACAREVGAEEALLCSIEDELVLAYAGDADKEKVRAHLSDTLDTYSVPDHLVRLPPGFTWPRLASGKLDRSSAAGQVTAIRNAESGCESNQIDPHCNTIVAAFVEAVESVSAGSRSIDPKKPLQLNSIQVMTLIGILNLTPSQARMLKNMPECSVEALAIQIHNCTCTAPELQTPLRILAELPEEIEKRCKKEYTPVFICPGAFGRTSNLRILAKELAKEGFGPVYGFETPFTEPRPGSISDLSAFFVEAIVDAEVKLSDKGCFIVGQSFGALLALSMEAELVSKGHRVNAVVALDPRRQCWLDASPSDDANSETNGESDPPVQAKGLQGHLRYTAALRAITMGSTELRLIYDEIRGATNPCEEFRSRMPNKHRNQTRAILRETETMVTMLDYCLALWQSIPYNHFRPVSPLLVLQACSEETGPAIPDEREAVHEVLSAMCCSSDSAPLIKLIPVIGDHFTIGYRENASSAAEAIRRHILGTPDDDEISEPPQPAETPMSEFVPPSSVKSDPKATEEKLCTRVSNLLVGASS